MSLKIGAIVEGEVTKITNFGAFVQLPERKMGLVHISEVSHTYVKDIHAFVKERDKVKVRILSIDERGKIALSMKQAAPVEAARTQLSQPAQKQGERRPGEHVFGKAKPTASLSFEERLSKFMKDSDSRMLDLKRNMDAKRGGRGARREK